MAIYAVTDDGGRMLRPDDFLESLPDGYKIQIKGTDDIGTIWRLWYPPQFGGKGRWYTLATETGDPDEVRLAEICQARLDKMRVTVREIDRIRRVAREAKTTKQLADDLDISYTYLITIMDEVELPTAGKIGRDIILWPPDVQVIRQRLGEDRRTKEYRASQATEEAPPF